jgi:tetratricopeptide (TPR) repeat protein
VSGDPLATIFNYHTACAFVILQPMAQGKDNDNAQRVIAMIGIEKPKLALFRNLKVLLIAGAAILLAICGFSIWDLYFKKSPPIPHVTITADEVSFVENEANSALQTRGLQAGLQVYSQSIAEAANSSVQTNLNLDAADMAVNNNAPGLALSYALQADSVAHSSTTSSLLASIYQQQGNTTKAITYYKKAAAEVKQNQLAGAGSQYYLDEAQALSQGVAQ